ncbi:SDR family NAD(P)-dependent oxidoreductase [Kytococcus sedentarius]|uniref:SDR family NAD(P)-dependent oxidoreductase n=1 Tax=Kytococcus sedentarius TaxID=1276 RepID=UPI0035BBBB88
MSAPSSPIPSRGVLVTGSSRGVGAATARAFAERGDRVVVHCHRNETAARAVCEALPGEGHTVLATDLADPDAVARLAADAIAHLGRVDVLVNNAALATPPDEGRGRRGDHPLEDTDYTDWVAIWQQTLATNLIGPAALTHQVARHMIDTPPADGVPVGRIVNIGSRGAVRGEPDIPAYGASKAGLHAFGQSMAVRLGRHGIAVTTLAPGFIETDMTADLLASEAGEGLRAQSPFGRVARPEEVAAAVVALADPGAEWASGAVVDFNGASHLR